MQDALACGGQEPKREAVFREGFLVEGLLRGPNFGACPQNRPQRSYRRLGCSSTSWST